LEKTLPIQILSTASVLPAKVITNTDMEKYVETSDEWITKMTGIKERHVLSGSETFISLSHAAAKLAWERAALDPAQIDMILIGTSTPEQVMPSSATILQGLLGIKSCIAFDLQAACSGFVYAMTTAYYFMQSDPSLKNALVMGCDALSRVLNWRDRSTCVLFGDGFGGVILGRGEDGQGIISCELGSDGTGKKDLEIPWGVAQGYAAHTEANQYIIMNGREVFKNSVTYFTQIIQGALAKNNLSTDAIDWIIPHQANKRIISAVAERLNVSADKIIMTVDKHSNTSAASIPLALDECVNIGKIKRGDKILLAGFGAGYTWGVVIFQF